MVIVFCGCMQKCIQLSLIEEYLKYFELVVSSQVNVIKSVFLSILEIQEFKQNVQK